MSDMNLEENRLRTFIFHSWPNNAPVDPEELASNGFFATGNFMETQCNWCQKKISDWQYGDQPMIRHRRLDPLCPFVLNPTISGNVSMSTSNNEATSETNNAASQSETALENNQQLNSQQAPSTPPQIDLKNEICRLATFKNWPNPNISPLALVKAGFYYLNKADQVKCAWCQGVIAKWERNDNAFDEHQRFFPDCPRVKLGPLIEISNDGMSDLGIQHIGPSRKPKFSCLDARLRTYAKWPIGDIQKPEILAQAGFYYQQVDDQVRCFHCNGGLRSWQKEDDPWFEHAKWFPLCQFLRLVKGQAYINHVEEIGRQSRCGNTTTNSEPVEVRLEHTPMTLDEAMVTEPVQQALEMGLNEGRIRSATKRHLDFCRKPFETTEELVEAVLEGQANEEEDGSNDLSSSIVREVSRILNNIFNPRNRSDSDNFDENTSSLTEDDDDSTSAIVGFNQNAVAAPSLQATTNPNSNDPVSISDDMNDDGSIHQRPTETTTATASNNVPVTDINSANTITPANTTTCGLVTISSNTTSTQSSSSCSTAHIPTSKERYSDIDLKKQLSLEEENRKLKDARLCKVCMDEEVGVVFLPCGHLATCVQCAPGVNACPLCRKAINGLVRTFLS